MGLFETVRTNVSARQAAEHYGLKVNRKGMACCPFHNDKNPSMKIDRRFYCFGCGEKGDAIDYVSRIFGIGLKEAAEKICRDFGITYDSDVRRPPPKHRCKKRETTPERIIEETEEYIFRVLCDYNHLLKKWKTEYKPNEADEEWHPYFVEALQETDRNGYLLDTMLTGSISDRAFLILDQGRKVREIEKRIQRIKGSA